MNWGALAIVGGTMAVWWVFMIVAGILERCSLRSALIMPTVLCVPSFIFASVLVQILE